jgi:AraC family transcriptional regulator
LIAEQGCHSRLLHYSARLRLWGARDSTQRRPKETFRSDAKASSMQQQAYRGYQQFYSTGPYANYLVEHRLAGSTTARLLHVAQPAGAFPDPPLPEFLIYVCLAGASRLAFDWGCGLWAAPWHPSDISIAPPNIATDIHVDRPHAFLALALPAEFVRSALDSLSPHRPPHFGELHAATFRDDFVARLFRDLWQQASCGEAQFQLLTDGLVFGMLSALAQRSHKSADAPQRGLDQRSFARVRDFIEACIGDNMSLHDLARVANVSLMHFARQFRLVAGTSPHQFVLDRRVARARALLDLTAHRIVDIAAAAGFSSQAHMTSTFTKRLGVTPWRYRALRLS